VTLDKDTEMCYTGDSELNMSKGTGNPNSVHGRSGFRPASELLPFVRAGNCREQAGAGLRSLLLLWRCNCE